MIRDAIKQVQRIHRKAIEATYDGTCRIYGMQSVKDPVTKVTRQEEVLVQDGIACHLSYSSAPPAAGSDTVTSVVQTIKLFLAPEWVISREAGLRSPSRAEPRVMPRVVRLPYTLPTRKSCWTCGRGMHNGEGRRF